MPFLDFFGDEYTLCHYFYTMVPDVNILLSTSAKFLRDTQEWHVSWKYCELYFRTEQFDKTIQDFNLFAIPRRFWSDLNLRVAACTAVWYRQPVGTFVGRDMEGVILYVTFDIKIFYLSVTFNYNANYAPVNMDPVFILVYFCRDRNGWPSGMNSSHKAFGSFLTLFLKVDRGRTNSTGCSNSS